MNSTYHKLPSRVRGALDALIQRLQERVCVDGGEDDLDKAEGLLTQSLAEVGRAAMAERLSAYDPGGRDVLLDGERYWEAVRGTGHYMTSFGTVTVERGVYRAVRNGPTVIPLDLRAPIIDGFWTSRAARLAALLVSDCTPYRAHEYLSESGLMAPSRSSLDRLPKVLESRWEPERVEFEEELRSTESVPPEAVSVAVSLDGVLVPMRDGGRATRKAATRSEGRADKGPAGYREVGCGSVSFYDKLGNRLATRRFAYMPEANKRTLKARLQAELKRVLEERPDLTIVAVADGAVNNWSFLEKLGAHHQVVDFYHAVEHLKRAIDTCLGPTTLENQAKFAALRRTLRDDPDGVAKVLAELDALSKAAKPKGHRAWRTGVTYFERHGARMNYAVLEKANLPIGSGVIEGTCKTLASDRLKRAGMRWAPAGGQAILDLRGWVQSGRFEAAFRLIRDTHRKPVHVVEAMAA